MKNFFTDEQGDHWLVPSNEAYRPIRLTEEMQVRIVGVVTGIVKCGNPKCITNNEPMTTIFHVISKENGVLKCHYCEKEQNKEAVKLL